MNLKNEIKDSVSKIFIGVYDSDKLKKDIYGI